MKTPNTSRINPSFFKQDRGEQTIRVIKAAQASKLLGSLTNGAGHAHNGATAHKKPEIRMVHAGADYCDLEVVCGCGESTQVRCWNTPVEQKAAA
jgi:hypothetical protein